MKSMHERTRLEDALDKQVSKSKLLCACIAQIIESLRRNRLGPGSNPAQPRFFSKGYSANLLLHIRYLKYNIIRSIKTFNVS